MGVGKQISLKHITSDTVEPLKENKNMLEDENDKSVRTITGGTFKKKDMLRD